VSAENGELAVGDTTTVRMPTPVEAEIVGLVDFSGGSTGPTFALFTFDEAQRYLMGGQDLVNSVLVAGETDLSQEALVERLTPVVPDGAEAITGSALTEEATDAIGDDFLNFFQTFLLVFAGIALLVAGFSIYNTFSITVAQRLRENALLRAIGSSRAQILVSVVLEALLVGIVASAVGLVAGMALAAGLKGLLAGFGLDLPSAGFLVDGVTVAWSFAVGIGVTIVASLAPAIRSSRVAPLAALREVAAEPTGAPVVRTIIGAFLAAAGIGLVASAVFGGDGVLYRAGGGAVLLLFGIIALGPAVARPMSAVLGAPLPALRGVTGALARQNAMRNPRRTAGTASALLVGVAVVSLFTVLASSIKSSIDEEVSRTFDGDLVVATDDFSASGLDPAMATEIADLEEVDRAVGVGIGIALIEGDEQVFTFAEPNDLASVIDLDVTEGSLADLGRDQIAVAEDTAEDAGLALGSTVAMEFIDGASETATVGAIYEEGAGNTVGTYVVPTETWAAHTPVLAHSTVIVNLADGVDLEAGRTAVEEVAAEYGLPEVQTRDDFIDSAGSQIDTLLYVVYALLALAIIIALMGISNTLSLSVHERTRELGLLRAVGQARSQTRSMVRWESVVVALFGTAGGLALGTFLGWALMRAVRATEGIGSFTAPIGQLALVLAVGAAVGIVAAIRPARRAARLDVLDAIAAE
jgi:putative ABC transport system permease protein